MLCRKFLNKKYFGKLLFSKAESTVKFFESFEILKFFFWKKMENLWFLQYEATDFCQMENF